jgi:hypothetical protein
VNEILLRQGRKLDLGRALLGLCGVAEEVRGRWLAEQPLVERVQAGAVVVRAFGLKIGIWIEKDLKNHLTKQLILNMSTCEVTFPNFVRDKKFAVVLSGQIVWGPGSDGLVRLGQVMLGF